MRCSVTTASARSRICMQSGVLVGTSATSSSGEHAMCCNNRPCTPVSRLIFRERREHRLRVAVADHEELRRRVDDRIEQAPDAEARVSASVTPQSLNSDMNDWPTIPPAIGVRSPAFAAERQHRAGIATAIVAAIALQIERATGMTRRSRNGVSTHRQVIAARSRVAAERASATSVSR